MAARKDHEVPHDDDLSPQEELAILLKEAKTERLAEAIRSVFCALAESQRNLTLSLYVSHFMSQTNLFFHMRY